MHEWKMDAPKWRCFPLVISKIGDKYELYLNHETAGVGSTVGVFDDYHLAESFANRALDALSSSTGLRWQILDNFKRDEAYKLVEKAK